MKGTDLDMRTSTLPTIYGEKVVIRILRRNEEALKPQEHWYGSVRRRKDSTSC